MIQAIPYPEASGVYKEGNKRYLPTSVAVAPNGDIYGADGYGMHHVHQWNAKGEYIRSWNGSDGAAGKFNTPHGIAVDCRSKEMKIIVADRANKRIQVFTPDGKYISHHLEGLVNPCKVYVRGEDLLIPDLQGKVTILDKDNKLVCHLGEAKPENKGKFGAPPESWVDGQFTAPHGAAWDSQGNAYVEDWNKTGRVTKLKRIK